MITTTWNDYRLSRLMLGTVQFGMPYGVANRTGQPEYRDVLAIVAAAVEGGVNCFDTAAAYGTSEEVLGRALHELGVADQVVIVTKIRPLSPAELSDSTLASRAIEQSVADSRRRLRLDCLPVVLFHREPDAVHRNVLDELQANGWVRHVGVSCDNRPGPAAEFVAGGNMSALQLPGNVLDQRHQRSGIFREAASQGVAVFLRSVYLQGLLVMPEHDIPPELRDVVPVRRKLELLAGEAGLSLAELALRYMLSQGGIMCVITGVETVAQVRDNLAIFDRGPLPTDLLAAIDAVSIELPETTITPSLWPPHKTG
ncbi:MAG: aldo/keto reductase [Candidatus Saccharimonas sp.]|nr:aldo/keto reductase [Planctomycetaceae bacterium]